MARYNYDRLSAQDNSFLLMETRNLPMHVGSLLVFESDPLQTPDGGIDFAGIRDAIDAVLHRIPRYRQKLHWIPFDQHAVWVDDPRFSLDFHLRHTALPRPGGKEQLKALAARIMAQPLDRNRPLWETWVVEGIDGGACFGFLCKVHHCMIDGVSGVDLSHILLSPSAEVPPASPLPEFIPRPAPTRVQLMRDETLRRLSMPTRVIEGIQTLRKVPNLKEEVGIRVQALTHLAGMGTSTDATPLNGKVGPHRGFDWFDVPLEYLKAIRRASSCSINDVVLTTVTGAVREYLLHRGVDPQHLDFRVSAPVSTRSDEERGKLGNRVSSWIVPLPIEEDDPRRQLERITGQTRELKETRQALGVELMLGIAEWTPSSLLSLGAQAISGPVNTIVTNVPGPQIPLYMRGARLKSIYPQAPLLDGMGLAIGLISYDGKVSWGIISDPDLVPDADVFVEMLQASLARLGDVEAVTRGGVEESEARPPALH
ncbi:MAG: wax ester/triacylglycerol synthase family O-acyltransferase [Myxococcota bacterium]|jgi:WS/DGAT/MGAT family acyltransferase|nr:wax ester/triacylglycerol synthase family O-acyltransferase [Deltaproteobacteria bacterium]MCP4241168.1 wax ester/triacylglycerol synthase family O-acyltransferase [bacterium]MDP6075120.1 wax ester/triacylglycerol synthase family O-acyltransferase [Myxococcota bacterium]MDP6242899.1 wax ester/triacylglycerol synthase family O-acyltransferase [Myxococcota bacterium]MDP7074770.1 wax ester/triacylglycerol synthase family O-acyltransferase [Myxococcota bacterium]